MIVWTESFLDSRGTIHTPDEGNLLVLNDRTSSGWHVKYKNGGWHVATFQRLQHAKLFVEAAVGLI